MLCLRLIAAASLVLAPLLAPDVPNSHPVTLHFRNGFDGYSGAVDRSIGGDTGVAHSATASPGHYWLRYGPPQSSLDERYNYLIRFDLSILPANARILSASLTLKAGNVYSPANVSARKLVDPDSLGSSFPTGWSNDGPAGSNAYRTGANAAFRNQTGVNAGTRWTAADPPDEHSHVDNAAAPAEPGATVRWDKGNSFYRLSVTQAVQDWVNGASPNQGWIVSATGDANIQDNFTNQDPNPANRPELIVTFLPPPGGDSTPPADIADLAVKSCVIDSCTLTWTAPGDNGTTGTAARYDVRYSISPLTEDNWDSAAHVVNPPAPKPAGSSESFTVTGLSQAIHYYFGVRALDAVWNYSGVSNSADGRTAAGIFATYHPRIHINRDLNLQTLKFLAFGPLRDDFNALRSTLDGAMSWNFDDLEENDLLAAVFAFGYMYQMTGDSRYADKLIDDYLIKASWMIDQTSTDNMAFGLECGAIAYDWTYQRLVERDQSTDPGILARVVNRIRSTYAASTDDVALFRETIREADFHNFVTEYINAWLTTGLALYGDHPDSIAMITRGWGMLGEGYSFQPTAFNDTFTYNLKASIDLTGGAMNWEGEGYWRNAVPEALRAIEAIDSASGRVTDLWHTVFANTVNAGYYKLYSMRPDLTTPGLGDSTPGAGFSWKDNFALVLLMSRFQDPYIRRLIDTDNGGWLGGRRSGLVMKLLFYDPSIASEDFSSLPSSRRFGRDIIMRSGWGSGDTFVTFSAGFSGVFHTHLDDNSFTIYRYADLANDGGYSLASPYYANYFKRTVAHNAITVMDPGDCWRDGNKDCSLSNDGGQRWPYRRFNPPFDSFDYGINRLWSATVLDDPAYREQFLTANVAFDAGNGYDYINSDDTRAYSNRWSGNGDNSSLRVSNAVRELLFLKPDWILVLDRVSSVNPNFRKSWLLHFNNPPSAANADTWTAANPGVTEGAATLFRADNGAGRLYVQTILPAGSKSRIIGGPGYQGWVNGQNYWSDSVPSAAPAWRIEVSPGAPNKDDLFLHVLYVTRSNASMPPVTALDAPGSAGVVIQTPSGAKIAVFSADTSQRQHVGYTAPAGAHTVADLAPGRYNVSIDGNPITTAATSPQGVLTFTTTSPGAIDIQPAQ